ncbi:MAG: hypothetical protein ACLR9G_12265 [Flavonifractor plautii]
MKQTQTLSPQMMQSMEILQMGSQELLGTSKIRCRKTRSWRWRKIRRQG